MALESAKKKIGGEVGTKNCSRMCDLPSHEDDKQYALVALLGTTC